MSTSVAARVRCWLLCSLLFIKTSLHQSLACVTAQDYPISGGRTLSLPLNFMRLLSVHFSCSWSLMWVATISFSALMPQPNLGLGTSLLLVLINQDREGHQSGHVKWYQTWNFQLTSVRLSHMPAQCSKIQISAGSFFLSLVVVVVVLFLQFQQKIHGSVSTIFAFHKKQTYFCIAFNQNICLAET